MSTNQLENTRPSIGLLASLAIAVLMTLWVFLQSDDVKNADVIELANVGSLKRPMASVAIVPPSQPSQAIQASTASFVGNSIAMDSLKLNRLKREPLPAKPYSLFKVHSWVVVPPVKKAKPAPTPPPAAPPAPFVYMGKLENTQKNAQIFLVANGKLYTPQPGEKIDQQWRFDAEEPNTLRLTYLPLNLPQVLSKSAKPLPMAAPVAEANLQKD